MYNIDEMNEVAFQLASLSANKNVLAAKLCEELHDVSNFQSTNNFKPLTIMLYESENYIIRSLIWFPPGPLYPADAFFYYEPHDHNFDFFTVGHFGSG